MNEKRISEATLTEVEKAMVLRASIQNVGRLLPKGMAIVFEHREGAEGTEMVLEFPNGSTKHAQFISCSPIHMVPFVCAVDEMFEQEAV